MLRFEKMVSMVSGAVMLFSLVVLQSATVFASFPDFEFDELTHTADIIFVGTVGDKTVRVAPNRRTLFTDVTFEDIEIIYKKASVTDNIGSTITLSYLGGQLGQVAVMVSDTPEFAVRQRYVVFALYDGETYSNPLVGGPQGLFRIARDEETKQAYPLNSFGAGLTGIAGGKMRLAGRVNKILKGMPEIIPSKTKFAPAPKSPAGAPRPAKTYVPEQESSIITLKEFVSEIKKTAAAPPPAKMLRTKEAKNTEGLIDMRSMPPRARRSASYTITDEGELILPDNATLPRCMSGSKAKALFDGSAFVNADVIRAAGDDLEIYGWQDLPINMHMGPSQWWPYPYDIEALGLYDMYLNGIFSYESRYLMGPDGYSDHCGFLTNDEKKDLYSASWGGANGMCYIFFAICQSCRIFETDVMFNEHKLWAVDYETYLNRDDVLMYRRTLMHELGHATGLMANTAIWDDELYNYDVATVMHRGSTKVPEDGRGIHQKDAVLLWNNYSDQVDSDAWSIKDMGVEAYYAHNGLVNATTNKTYWEQKSFGTYFPGEEIPINNITVENMGPLGVPNVRLRTWLSPYRSINGNFTYYPLNLDADPDFYDEWTFFSPVHTWVGSITRNIPYDILPGTYYVCLQLTSNADDDTYEDYWANNFTSLLYPITVTCPKPASPDKLFSPWADEHSVVLTWEVVENAQHYRVRRGTTQNRADAAVLAEDLKTNQYVDTTGVPGVSYCYFVQAQTACGAWSDTSPCAFGKRLLTAPCVGASDGSYSDRVAVTATPMAGATHYKLYYAETETPLLAAPAGGWQESNRFSVVALQPGKTYYFWAKASLSSEGEGETELGTCFDTGWRKLATPTVSAGEDSSDHIFITWNEIEGATHYRLYRNTVNNPSTAEIIMDWWRDRTSFSDSTAQKGIQYYYWAQAAINSRGDRSSNLSSPDTGYKTYSPAPRVELGQGGATKGTYADRVRITWEPVTFPAGVNYYRVYRSASDNATAAGPITGWIQYSGSYYADDFTAAPGAVYWYWVSAAYSTAGDRESLWQQCSYCTDFGYRKTLSASAVSASSNLSDRIRVTWQPVSGAVAYKVYRNTSANAAAAERISALVEGTSFDDDDKYLAANTSYYYWVTSFAAAQGSPESVINAAWYGVGRKAADAPAVLTASDGVYEDKVLVTWSSVPGMTHYRLYRGTTDNPAEAQPQGAWMTATAYSDTFAVRGQTYYYWVQAAESSSGGYATAFSAPDTGWRRLNAASSVTATDGTYTDRVLVTWMTVSDATHYRVYRNDVQDLKTALPVSPWLTGLSFEDTTALVGKTCYYYVASARSDTGEHESPLSTFDTGFRVLAPPKLYYASKGVFPSFVSLKWEKGSSDATHFRVYRSTYNVPPADAYSDWRTEAYFEDRGAVPGEQYFYWVKAATDDDGSNLSGMSNSGNGELGFLAETAGCDDPDRDRICSGYDNCPNTPNPGQQDSDDDGVGDWCDNCPEKANQDQLDSDHDGLGDACDNCPNNQAPDQTDTDSDGVGDACDNCPNDSNPDQADSNGNGIGDACDVPTLIQLASFTADTFLWRAVIRWTTESEIDTTGFNLYRAEAADGRYEKVNAAVIPAKGDAATGASYRLIDDKVEPGKTYYYRLEDIDTAGKSTMHGPVSVTVRVIDLQGEE